MNPPDDGDGRTCHKCGVRKPNAELVPYSELSGVVTWKFWSTCKVCHNRACVEYEMTRATTIAGRAARLLSGARQRAAKKGLDFTITLDWLVDRLRPMRCEVSGVELVLERGCGRGNFAPHAPSLDQIAAGGGYTPGNSRIVCDTVNRFLNKNGLDAALPAAVGIAVRHAPAETAEALRALGYSVLPPAGRVAA